ncbi:MAG: alpha/beta hydrolase [Clostridia bacterium]|nr:alpha/beta hydrolase [Clostridia bacterium]
MHNNPGLEGMAYIVPDVVYSHALQGGLTMTLILPWHEKSATVLKKRPLIVFVQGSGWTHPNIYKQIPQLSRYAQAGYAVATLVHRNAAEGHPFPAYLEDTKTAIRFLRAHADEYGIDTEQVCIFGTSSGGNTAMLVALTGDDARFKTKEYAEYSDSVSCCVECFGPSDLIGMLSEQYIDRMHDPALDNTPFIAPFRGLVGKRDVRQVLKEMSPVNYIDSGKKLPPMLIIQGDADDIVPYEQGKRMYERMYDAGAAVKMIRVENAPHEGSFWSEELHGEILKFIGEHIR